MTIRRTTPPRIARVRIDPGDGTPFNPQGAPGRSYARVKDPAPDPVVDDDDVEEAPVEEPSINGRTRPVPAVGGNGPAAPFLRGNTGRPPGSKNQLPAKIKQAIAEALDDYPGGAKAYMAMLMRSDTSTFGGLLKRMLPQTIRTEIEPGSLMSRMLQAAAAQRAVSETTTIDVTPTRTLRRPNE